MGGLFAAGILVGTAIGGWGMLQARKQAVWQQPVNASALAGAPTQAAAPPAAIQASQPAVAAVPAQRCDTTAIVPRGTEDGREALQPTPSGATASEVASLILKGKEAAASGRMRDAEIAFLNACRNAEAVQGADPLPIADAMYQLGRHYVNLAQADGTGRKNLLERSERLYAAAGETFSARYGASGEKTRFAVQGLAAVQQLASGKAPAVAVAAPTGQSGQAREPGKRAPSAVAAKAPPARPAVSSRPPEPSRPVVAGPQDPSRPAAVARSEPQSPPPAQERQVQRPRQRDVDEPIARQERPDAEPVVTARPTRPAPRAPEPEPPSMGDNGAPTASGSVGNASGDAADE